ncbi:MAG: hypothetical protein LC667_12810 [Thioalkalivibrio sp.]|nr:hypothetical protein [Thioalkalivibrio sp.]
MDDAEGPGFQRKEIQDEQVKHDEADADDEQRPGLPAGQLPFIAAVVFRIRTLIGCKSD